MHIYDIAGMNVSGSYWKSERVENLAVGYSSIDDSFHKDNYDFLPVRGSPAGGGYSTVKDLLKFAVSLSSNQLLNVDYTDLVTKGKVDLQEKKKYAYGFYDQLENGIQRIGHSGGAPGINFNITNLSKYRVYHYSYGKFLISNS